MRNEQFNDIIDETLDNARAMLTRKSSGYSTEDDRLHNFRTGAALNGVTMEQVCWGMATKHIVSIRDMVMSEEKHPEEVWDEKIGDAINYLAILKAITVENDVNVEQNPIRNETYHSLEVPPAVVTTAGPFSTTANNQQRDIAAIKRVADKNSK